MQFNINNKHKKAMYVFWGILCLIITLFSVSCKKSNNENQAVNVDDDLEKTSTVLEKETFLDENSNHQDCFGITIYQISPIIFQELLQNPEYDISNCKSYKYTNGPQTHITFSATLFNIEQKLIDFLGDYSSVEKYLSENSINTTVKKVIIIESSGVPITALLKTTSGFYFITVELSFDNEVYEFNVYNQKDFVNKYKIITAKISLYGKTLDDTITAKIYSNSARIPLLAVLKELGVKIEWESDTYAKLYYGSKEYNLDTQEIMLCEIGKKQNLIHLVEGGFSVFSYDGKEVTVDDRLLKQIISGIIQDVDISFDREKEMLCIVTNK